METKFVNPNTVSEGKDKKYAFTHIEKMLADFEFTIAGIFTRNFTLDVSASDDEKLDELSRIANRNQSKIQMVVQSFVKECEKRFGVKVATIHYSPNMHSTDTKVYVDAEVTFKKDGR